MKKTLLFVLPIALLAAHGIYADNAFSTAPAPAQSYHAAGSADSSQAAAITDANAPVTTSTPVMSTASVDMSPSVSASLPQTASEDEMQQANQRIQNLVASNQAMGAAIQTIDQTVSQLQQEVSQLETQHGMMQNAPSVQYAAVTSDALADLKTPVGMSIAGLILLGLGVLFARNIQKRLQDRLFSSENTVLSARSQKINSGRPDILVDEEVKSEYDFMGTAEAIPAKLDLARSYMVMNDHDQAYVILKTVMEKGNEEQRLEAQLLIQKIIKKK